MRRFRRRDDGVAAVEFGMVALPFFAMLFAIMETAIVFFAGQTLETAVADSSRLILTGQAQTAGMTQSGFKDQVCARIFGMFDCKSGVTVDVQKYSSFASADLSRPVDTTTGKVKPGQFNPGGPCEIVVVRLIYEFPVFMDILSLADMASSKRLLVATSVFRNEPYQGTCS